MHDPIMASVCCGHDGAVYVKDQNGRDFGDFPDVDSVIDAAPPGCNFYHFLSGYTTFVKPEVFRSLFRSNIMAKNKIEALDSIPCTFGTASGGTGQTASMRLTAPLDELPYSQGIPVLVNARLDITLNAEVGGDDDAPGQGTFVDDRITVQGIADVHSVTVTDKTIAFTCGFNKGDVDPKAFWALAGRSGEFSATRTGAAGGDKPADPADGGPEGEAA